MNIPKKLPTAELNIAAASFPDTAFVNMTADDTGGGMHPNTNSPCRRSLSNGPSFINDTRRYISEGKTMNVHPCIKKCTLNCTRALLRSSLRSEIPLLKNMMATAKNLTVISGLRIPPLAPILGAMLAKQITIKMPQRNQLVRINCATIIIALPELIPTTAFFHLR